MCKVFFSMALQPPWFLASDFQFHDHFTDGRTPWMSDQLVTSPLPKHRTTQTQNRHIYIRNIHALCGIKTHDLGFRASDDSACLRSCPAWERRASTCERELLPHADKHIFVYVLELCKSEAKRPLPRRRFYSPGPFMFDRCFYSHLVFHNGNIHRKSDISFQKTRALRPQKQSLS
jgi:hypothetical protein